jgi:hypothetical protein
LDQRVWQWLEVEENSIVKSLIIRTFLQRGLRLGLKIEDDEMAEHVVILEQMINVCLILV